MTLRPPYGPINPPGYPFPRMLFEEEVTTQYHVRDAELKSQEQLYWMGHPVQALPVVLPYPVPITKEKEQWFWHGKGIVTG